MKISMAPHSGVVAFDFMDRPFPVVGWYSMELENGDVKLVPLVLDRGRLLQLDDDKVRYSLVGWGQEWRRLLDLHNAEVQWPG